MHLDDEALREIDAIVARNVGEPVGPEFMAPPEHKPATAPRSSVV